MAWPLSIMNWRTPMCGTWPVIIEWYQIFTSMATDGVAWLTVCSQ